MKRLHILFALILIVFPAYILAGTITPYVGSSTGVSSENLVIDIMKNVTSTSTGSAVEIKPRYRTVQAVVSGTGAVTATVRIQISMTGTDWIDATVAPHIALAGVTSATDGFLINAKWPYVRAIVDAISGTNAKVTVYVGV